MAMSQNFKIFLLLLAIGTRAVLCENGPSTTTASSSTPTNDETNSSSESTETDASSSNNFEMKIESPDKSSESSGQDQSSQESHSSAHAQQQQLMQLLQQSQPGQFMPLVNKEVAPGHVTMIGYTTPIVKVGDPIPLDQFLKQQQQMQQQNAIAEHQQQQHAQQQQLMPPSSTSQQEFAKFLARITQDPASAGTSSLLPANGQGKQDPYQLLLQPPQEQAKATLVQLNGPSADALKPAELEKQNPQMSFDDGFNTNGNIGELPTTAGGQTVLVDPQQLAKQQQAQGNLVQAEPQQFVQPLEKPRPFLVYKPGFKPPQQTQQITQPKQLLQHIQIDHLQAKSAGQGPQKLISQFGSIDHSSENEIDQQFPAGFHPLAPPHLPSVSSQLIKQQQQQQQMAKPLQHHFEWEPVKQSQPQPPAQITPFSAHQYNQSPLSQSPIRPMMFGAVPQFHSVQQSSLGQAHSSFLRSAQPGGPISGALIKTEAPTIVETESHGGGSSVDTRAELQNQIKHVLTTSPNLSEDSRKRHRDAIMKAVQSLVDATTSNHQTGIATVDAQNGDQGQQHFVARPAAGTVSQTPINQFPSFHPKSMLFQYPKAAVQPQQTPISSILNNVQQPKKQQSPFTSLLTPQDSLPNPPFSFLNKYPSLLPGLQSVAQPEQPKQLQLVHSPPASSAQQAIADQKIQNQIQHFLQQHDPQRQQAAQLVAGGQQHHHHHHHHHGNPPPSFFANLLPQSTPSGHPPRFLIEDTSPIYPSHNAKLQFPAPKIRLAPGLMLSSEQDAHGAASGATSTNNAHQTVHPSPSSIDANKHTHHHHHHRHNHHSSSLMSSYQPETASHLITPKQTMRGYSEWWKERALISDDGHTSISGAVMNSHPTALAPFNGGETPSLFAMPVA